MKLLALSLLGLLPFAAGQTYTSCNPTEKDNCPADPALGGHVKIDLTKQSDLLKGPDTGNVSYGNDGAKLTINKSGDGPTLISDFYIMFGHVDVEMKMAPGGGIVSSLVLLSDDQDEIDFETLGGTNNQVHTNFFGHVDLTDYNNDQVLSVDNVNDDFHTYSIDWTADQITWSIDNQVSRTVTAASAGNKYPQTPMQLKIGPWPAGDSESQGTVEWAGGKVDWSKAPFEMYIKSAEITDYSTGKEYSYKDRSGSWQSIEAANGKVNTSGSPGQGDDKSDSTTASSSSDFSAGSSTSAPTGSSTPTFSTSPTSCTTDFTVSSPSASYPSSYPTESFIPPIEDSGAETFFIPNAPSTLLSALALAIPALLG